MYQIKGFAFCSRLINFVFDYNQNNTIVLVAIHLSLHVLKPCRQGFEYWLYPPAEE